MAQELCNLTREEAQKPNLSHLITDGIATEKRLQIFLCPSEKVGIGKRAEGKFDYGHYGANLYLQNDNPFFKTTNNAWRRDRSMNDITKPSIAITIMDSCTTNAAFTDYHKPSADIEKRVTSRHGGGVVRGAQEGEVYYPYYAGNSTNVAYFDGHVAAVSRYAWIRNGNYSYYILQQGIKP
jgi:prepilin-type processing-associated H-X9-DG protein